jgi:hypothetical protein
MHGDFDTKPHKAMAWIRQRVFIARKCKLDKNKNYMLGDESRRKNLLIKKCDINTRL